MGLLPDTKVGKIEWTELRVSPWTSNAVAMGSSTSAVSAWSTKVTTARTAYNTQQAAQEAAKVATNNLNIAIDALMVDTASIIKSVRSKADVAGNGIYSLASIPVPATPAPKPAPGKPSNLVATLSETGVIDLAWRCANPEGTSGTLYQIWRQIGEAGEMVYLGGSGEKEFADDTLPAGSMNVMYQLQAVRSTAVGPFATFNVKFGVGAGGATTATVTERAPVRIAS